MREDIDIRLLDYYIHNITTLSKSGDISDKQDNAESETAQTGDDSTPESTDKH